MIRYRFGRDDLLRSRFAVSPLFEIVWSSHILRRPERAPLHRPWVAAARAGLAGLDWALLDRVANGYGERGYVPDFITPPPATPFADLDGELDRVRATPHHRVALEVAWRFEGREVPAVVRPLLDDPAAGLDRLVAVMRAYWQRAIEPWWPAIRAVLEADIVHRARRLTAGGAIEVFAGLHHGVRWRDGAVEVEHRTEHDVDLRGRGLLLVPTVFAWPEVFSMIDEPWQPALIYTPRGVGALWAPAEEPDPGALDALLGRRRAAILRALGTPATTHDLAERLAASPGGVSEHLGVLRRAGLARAQRDGRRVLYTRTAAGEQLLRRRGAA
jgi:DNA-binding transcriptional ArsR family regulator